MRERDIADFREWMTLQRNSEISLAGGMPTKMLRLADTGLGLCERIAEIEAGLKARGEIDALMSAQAAAQPVLAIENWPRVVELKTALVDACDGWSARDSEGFDIEERNALVRLAEGKP